MSTFTNILWNSPKEYDPQIEHLLDETPLHGNTIKSSPRFYVASQLRLLLPVVCNSRARIYSTIADCRKKSSKIVSHRC